MQMVCVIPIANIRSRIYVVGQLQENCPGVILGNREPHLREKTIGIFRKELATFGAEFAENDFLMEYTREINEENYELNYFKLTHIKLTNGAVELHSDQGELLELRETHKEVEDG